MTDTPTDGIIDDVAPGDIVSVPNRAGDHKVVHKEEREAGHLVTFETDDGETFQLELAAGTPARRALESKWESTQSPTPHS
ncbi:hypothetical protein ACTJJE_03555 [Mycolicibacterium sp. 22603]|uniref:hypothetical protein n=1 Tax=Mycolicibacterium sp. 22603 TaxID=3453950 RepID=UPI003F82833F